MQSPPTCFLTGLRCEGLGCRLPSPPQQSPTGHQPRQAGLRLHCLQWPCLFASGQPRSVSLVGQCLRPASGGSGWVGVGSGNPCPCGHVAAAQPWSLKQASGNPLELSVPIQAFWVSLPLSFWQNRSVPVASFAQKPKPRQSPPFPGSQCSKRHYFPSCPKELVSLKCVPQRRESSGPAARHCGGSGRDWVPSRAGGVPALVGLSAPLSGQTWGIPRRSYRPA